MPTFLDIGKKVEQKSFLDIAEEPVRKRTLLQEIAEKITEPFQQIEKKIEEKIKPVKPELPAMRTDLALPREEKPRVSPGRTFFDIEEKPPVLVSPEIETIQPEIQESKIKDIGDAFRLGASEIWHKSKQFFVSALPNFVFKDVEPISYSKMTGIPVEKLEERNKYYKDFRIKFKEKYLKADEKYQEWTKSHPELQPRKEWEKGVIETVKEKPKILLDPAYWGYVASKSAAFTLGVMGTTLAVTAATGGNPWAGIAAGVAVATPMQAQDLYEDLINEGATEEQAGQLSMAIGPIIASVEVAGDLPLLRAVSKPFSNLLTKNVRKEVVKRTMAGLVKKGLKTFTAIEIAETLEEIAQGAIQDATVKTVNQNRDILANIPETTIQTLIATVPFALAGLGGEISREIGRKEIVEPAVKPPVVPPTEAPIIPPTEVPEVAPPITPTGVIREGLQPIVQFAKKFDSAEEFIKAIPQNKEIAKLTRSIPNKSLKLLWQEVTTPTELPIITEKKTLFDIGKPEVPKPAEVITPEKLEAPTVTPEYKVSPELEPLVREAKKYKSAEDFVKAIENAEDLGEGIFIKSKILPVGGWVISEGTLGPKKHPAYLIKLPDGTTGALHKDNVEVLTGWSGDLRDFYALATGKAKTEITPPKITEPTDVAYLEHLKRQAEKMRTPFPSWGELATFTKRGGEIDNFFHWISKKMAEIPAMKPYLVKKQVRIITGQKKYSELIREDKALKRLLQMEERISKQAYRLGAAEQKEKTDRIRAMIEERQAIKEEVRKYVADINRLPTKNLPLDYKDKINEIKDPFDLKRRTARTLARRDSMRGFVARMQEQGEEIRIPQEKLDLLEKVSLNNMTIDDLREVHGIIMQLYHQGRLKNKLITTMQDREFDEIINEGVDTITKGEGITEEASIVRELREQSKSFKVKTIDGIKNYIAIHLRPERILNMMDSWKEGINTKAAFNPLLDAERSKLETSNQTLTRILEINKDIDKGEAVSKKHKIGRFEGMKRDNALFIYANSFNDANAAHLRGSGVTEEDIENVTNFLSDTDKKAVEDMINFYDTDQWPAIEKVYSDLEGVHLGKEYQYFPIMNLEDISAIKAIEQELTRKFYVRKPGVSKGFTKERITSKKGFDKFSYFETIYKNWQNVEHYKAYAKAIRDASKYLNNPKIKTAIKQKYGDAIFKELDRWLKDVSYGGDQKAVSAIDIASRWLRTNYVTSVLGYNLVSMCKAPASFFQGAHFIGEGAAINGAAHVIKNPLEANRFINSKSPFMKYRAFSQERELREIIAKRGIRAKFGKREVFRLIREESLRPWMIIDKATCNCIWMGAYQDVIKTGKVKGKEIPLANIEEAAVKWADEAVRKTQPMGSMLNLPGVFRGPEIQKMYTLFKNQLNQNLNLIYELYRMKGGISVLGNFKEWVLGSIFYILVPAFIMGMISRKRFDLKDYILRDVPGQVLGGMFLLSHAVQSWGSVTPIDAIITDIRWMIRSKEPITRVRNAIRALAKVTGVPYTQMERFIKGQPFGRIESGEIKKIEKSIGKLQRLRR